VRHFRAKPSENTTNSTSGSNFEDICTETLKKQFKLNFDKFTPGLMQIVVVNKFYTYYKSTNLKIAQGIGIPLS
jgi:hypothetical protein